MTQKSLTYRALPLAFAATAACTVLSSHQALAATSVKYTGSTAQMDRWGPIQVTVTVKNKKITNVSAKVAPDNPRSSFIESNALPALKQEVLQAQNLNIQLVSGATDTSNGYLTSLQSALKKAVKAKTLKSSVLKG